MFYVVSYDIPDDKRRNTVSQTLQDFGKRVQKSVFECILDDENLEKMKARLKIGIKETEDRIRIYALCSGCVKKTIFFGPGEITADEDIYIG